MYRYLLYLLILLWVMFLGLGSALAQGTDVVLQAPQIEFPPLSYTLGQEDSLQIAKSTKLAENLSKKKAWEPKSGKALLWALIPGGGQVYNRKYWKLPIVWGSLMTCAYFIGFNSRQYEEYHAAYRDIMSEDPSKNTAWLAFAPHGAKAEDYAQYSHLKGTLQRGDEYYRRYRDLSIVLAVGIYGLSILDAYVDAELFTFDISPDLSMRLAPTIMPSHPYSHQGYKLGMTCQLTF